MNKALNRIEYEYIADTFVREKPPLSILCKNTFVKIDSSSYKLIDGYVFFKADGVEVNDDMKVFLIIKNALFIFLAESNKKRVLRFLSSPINFINIMMSLKTVKFHCGIPEVLN